MDQNLYYRHIGIKSLLQGNLKRQARIDINTAYDRSKRLDSMNSNQYFNDDPHLILGTITLLLIATTMLKNLLIRGDMRVIKVTHIIPMIIKRVSSTSSRALPIQHLKNLLLSTSSTSYLTSSLYLLFNIFNLLSFYCLATSGYYSFLIWPLIYSIPPYLHDFSIWILLHYPAC